MRQRLGKKKVDKLRKETGLDIIAVLVRGGTHHRRDLCIRGGSIVSLWNDGTMTIDLEQRHRQQEEQCGDDERRTQP